MSASPGEGVPRTPCFGAQGSSEAAVLAELVAVTDVYVWKVLRRDVGLGRAETERAIGEMIAALA